jgi:nitrite reductase/ring-hydroxylating ferredoxin subunit/uncharacterized membrane protein
MLGSSARARVGAGRDRDDGGDMTTTAPPPSDAKPALHRLAARVGDVGGLDAPAERLAAAVQGALQPGRARDALSGTFLGHALHPLLTDLPIGTWTSATLLDLVGGPDSATAARRLVAAGILSSVPTAVTGSVEWADTAKSSASARRIGVVHAAANVAALALYTGSYLARRRGRRGRALALAGAGALAVGGHLGGHLSYVEGVGVSQTAFDEGPHEWTPTISDAELPEGAMASADADGVRVLLARRGGRIHALANRCNHRGGPLDEGELADGCVTCPWHGSRFRLADGSVERGPAATPQPAFDARVRDGRIEVRRRTEPTGS